MNIRLMYLSMITVMALFTAGKSGMGGSSYVESLSPSELSQDSAYYLYGLSNAMAQDMVREQFQKKYQRRYAKAWQIHASDTDLSATGYGGFFGLDRLDLCVKWSEIKSLRAREDLAGKKQVEIELVTNEKTEALHMSPTDAADFIIALRCLIHPSEQEWDQIAAMGHLTAPWHPFYGNKSSEPSVKATVQKRLDDLNIKSSEQKRYAVLLNGDGSDLHYYNIGHAYNALKKMGFEEDDILILSDNNPRLSCPQDPFVVNGICTQENVTVVFDYLSRCVDKNDVLVIYGTGHGVRKNNQSWISLKDYSFSAKRYEALLNKIKAQTVVNIMDQCYSGGFSAELADAQTNVVSLAAASEEGRVACTNFSEILWNEFVNFESITNQDVEAALTMAYDLAMTALNEEQP